MPDASRTPRPRHRRTSGSARPAAHPAPADRDAPPRREVAPRGGDLRRVLLVCAGIALATLAVYAQTAGHAFIVFDDDQYLFDNPHVATGLTAANAAWAFTAYHANNWHPVTWLSHMLDVQLFGLAPGPHHLMGAALHLANSLLVFLLLRRMTGALWRSAFVAAAFAVHPMHVESVAWASERKDVLSALLGLITIWAYVSYARRPDRWRYAAVVAWYAVGLMAKPMLVTLPFVLLLLDVWPLRRWPRADAHGPPRSVRALLVEKLPLLGLALASSILTLVAQSRGGVVRSLEDVTPAMRAANALVSYARYLGKLLVPIQQAFYYPYPRRLPVLEAVAAALLLIAITTLVVRLRRERPYLLVGWWWFAGTLVPVIGLVQVASQALADRYAYLPSIGLFVGLAWSVADVSRRWPRREMVLACVAAVTLAGWGVKAWAQTRHWQNSIALFTHDARAVPGNGMAYRNLGLEYHRLGRYDEAITAIDSALAVYPHETESLFIMAASYASLGRLAESERRYREAVTYHPNDPRTHFKLGSLLNGAGRPAEAVPEFEAAIRLEPGYAEAHNDLGNALGKLGRTDEAVARFREAMRLSPGYAEPHSNLGSTLHKLGRNDEALAQYDQALEINPRLAAAQYNAAIVCLEIGDTAQAMTRFDEAVRLDPRLVNPFQYR